MQYEHPITITQDELRWAYHGFDRVNVGDTVDGMWGHSTYELTVGDIRHLLNGGCLYTNNGEYAGIIVLKRTRPDEDEYEDLAVDDEWDYSDICYECTGYGDDYSWGEDGEIVSACPTCPFNRYKED